jgi:prepilin-type N-terminal cleavage/methylation domain-containing protein
MQKKVPKKATIERKAFSLIELSVVVVIIALIIVAITQSSRLVSQMRLMNARKLTNNSAIPALNNIIAWYDATSIEAFDVNQTNHTNKISKWVDSEVRVHERIILEQTNTNNQPIYQTNSINGLPSIYFDGNDYLEGNEKRIEGILSYYSGSFFMVFEVDEISTKQTIFSQNNQSTADGIDIGIGFNVNGDYGLCSSETNCTNGNNTTRSTNAIISAKKKSVLSIIVNNTNNVNIYQDSNLVSTTNNYNPTGVNFGLNKIMLGAKKDDTDNLSSYFKGKIAEILIFNRFLAGEDRREIERYLGKKWNIKISNID